MQPNTKQAPPIHLASHAYREFFLDLDDLERIYRAMLGETSTGA